jgi:hypothetical protein
VVTDAALRRGRLFLTEKNRKFFKDFLDHGKMLPNVEIFRNDILDISWHSWSKNAPWFIFGALNLSPGHWQWAPASDALAVALVCARPQKRPRYQPPPVIWVGFGLRTHLLEHINKLGSSRVLKYWIFNFTLRTQCLKLIKVTPTQTRASSRINLFQRRQRYTAA